jgi:hypothetical protein
MSSKLMFLSVEAEAFRPLKKRVDSMGFSRGGCRSPRLKPLLDRRLFVGINPHASTENLKQPAS